MTRLVVTLGWSLRWTVRAPGLPHLRSRRDQHGDLTFETADGDPAFRLIRRGRAWRVEGLPEEADIRSEPYGDSVRRAWFVDTPTFTWSATENGTARSGFRQIAGAFAAFPFHLAVRTALTVSDVAGAAPDGDGPVSDVAVPVGRIVSRRTLPISYVAEVDDDRLHPLHLAALTVLIASS